MTLSLFPNTNSEKVSFINKVVVVTIEVFSNLTGTREFFEGNIYTSE